MRGDDGLRRGQFIVADRTNGRDAAANDGCADTSASADTHASAGTDTHASAGSDTHANAGTNTNISDRKMGGRNARWDDHRARRWQSNGV